MHRIYCDSNIFRVLKPEHPSFNIELLNAFSDLKEILFFVFSDAHLDDLKNSTDYEKTKRDLLLIGEYCNDNYLSYGLVGKEKNTLQVYLATPLQAFENKDYEAAKNAIAEISGPDFLLNIFDGIPEIKELKPLLEAYLDLPIGLFNNGVATTELDEQSKEQLNKLLPGYNANMSLGNLINNIMPYAFTLLNDKKEFTELRKYTSNYLNSNELTYKKWGMQFSQQLKNSAIGKTFSELLDNAIAGENKHDPHYRFTFAYSLLEVLGITNEGKKFTYDSLSRDADHAFYAASCNFLVTDDKGLQVKAHILYNMMGVETKILSSKDFINRRAQWLGNEESYSSFLSSFTHDRNHSFQVFDHIFIDSGINLKEFKTGHPYFNYFNRYQLTSQNSKIYSFYCKQAVAFGIYFYREIELLTKKMIKAFGPDDENKGIFKIEEKNTLNDGKKIRSWTFNSINFTLIVSRTSTGDHFVLETALNQ